MFVSSRSLGLAFLVCLLLGATVGHSQQPVVSSLRPEESTRQLLAFADTKPAAEFERAQVATHEAIASGLKWLAAHQEKDGSWTFAAGPNAGNLPAPVTSTAMALLPFLQTGHTHQKGAYREQVGKALQYLLKLVRAGQNGADMREPGASMYGHGLAAVALSQAYALTADPQLKQPAQQVIDFTIFAQDPVGGGWRYAPQQPGDTSILGWQLTALENAKAGQLTVPDRTFQSANRFLDNVQSEQGSAFGYTSPGKGPNTTCIGLLSRIYLGSKPTDPAIKRGIANTFKTGLSEKDAYFNYYSTQLMQQADRQTRAAWNKSMRDFLITSQSEDGSWYFQDNYLEAKTGRTGITALCLTTLAIANQW